jgi:quinoprotein glucose dehydrogenase
MNKLRVVVALLLGGSIAGLLALITSPPARSQGPAQPYSPKIAPASNEATTAIKRIRVPQGLRVDLFAAEPMLANPVCFCVDEHNRFYVAETFRYTTGVTDIRDHMDWLDDDLACRTVDDRVALLKKHLGGKFATYEVEHDRIRLIEDTKGAGKADRATVFADGFHHAADGIGAGLLARRGQVWFACIPDLWLLRDTKGDGKANVRRSLQHGYGVHVGFIGHDLHGLRMGPDGKLYFSIGDRGLNVHTSGRTIASPDAGAVLRCNPDGSELEIVATGLRNPQELAFDQYGNLFTGDNNADHGDKARWVYIVEGGDSGWRIGYQFMESPVALGPWNAEKLWHTPWDGQAAYLVPPVAHVADGPAGLTYHPGTSLLPERYREHFFLCDFRGGSGQSGIRSFAVQPKGASFEMVDQHEFVWSVLATDVDFGMDGALYLSDWVEGWDKPNKGRLYKVHDPARAKDAAALEVKKLMAEGMMHRSLAELVRLLEHPDMRVRQEAQFAIVEKASDKVLPADEIKKVGRVPADEAIRSLVEVARKSKQQLARLHALWALGQIARDHGAWQPVQVVEFLGDRDPEVRAQAAKVLGEGRRIEPDKLPLSRPPEPESVLTAEWQLYKAAYPKLVPLLRDERARVRFFAALSLGKISARLGHSEAVEPIVQMLRDNADKDAYLRHAGVMALTWMNDEDALHKSAVDDAPAVRLAVLLAWRRLERPEVARFLNDADPRLVLEAARAINDVPITAALPQLAALSRRTGLSEPLLYRVLNAHFRLGRPENAAAIASLAARADIPEALRIEALRELGDWARPSGRDRIVGLWRPLEPRPAGPAVDALRASLGGVFSGPDRVRQEGARVAGQLGIREVGPLLLKLLGDKNRPTQVRVETLRALAALNDKRLQQAMQLALADDDPKLRTEGRRVLARLRPAEAVGRLEGVLERGSSVERQGAFSILADVKDPAADVVLARWLDKLLAGQVPPELQLDLLEAAGTRPDADLKQKLARYEAARPKTDPLARYRETLAGGDAEAGRRIFFNKTEVACVRCHKVKGEGGEVGPDLTGIGTRQNREYLLEAIVEPNRQIAKGFETVVLILKDDQIHTGIVKAEDDKHVKLMTAEGKLLTIPKDQITERNSGKSAMPEDIVKSLSKAELRDLVEFLVALKQQP